MKSADELRDQRLLSARENESMGEDDYIRTQAVFKLLVGIEECIRECPTTMFDKEWVLTLLDAEFSMLWDPESDTEYLADELDL